MIKSITILIIILFGYLLYKIKLGYILIATYLISFIVNPIHENIEQFLQQHEFLGKVYDVYFPYVLLVFLLFSIGTKLFSKKKKNLISHPNEIVTPAQTEPIKEYQVQKINSDGSFVNNSETELTLSKTKAEEEKYKDIDNRFINLMTLQKSFWDSPGEEKVYDALKGFINNEDYIISPHVGLREMFFWGWKYFNFYENFRVSSMHFDFVIHDKNQFSNCPALVIEVWGKDHYDEEKPWIRRVDYFKQSILKKCKIPFVVIDMSESIPDDKISELVIDSIKKEVPSREFYNVYCPKCGKVMIIKFSPSSKKFFYGCSGFDPKNPKSPNSCKGNRSIPDLSEEDNDVQPLYVQPLYRGIPTNLKNK